MEDAKNQNGCVRAIYLPSKIDELVEDTRKKLGYSRSAFHRYAITRLLQDLSLLSKEVKDEETMPIVKISSSAGGAP